MPNGVRQRTFLPGWARAVLIGRRPRATLIRIAVLVISTTLVFGFMLLPVRLQGPSMEPTYQDGSVNFINRLAFLFHGPHRGDVVGIRYSGLSTMLCKRVIGLPGDTVEFTRGQARINGHVLDEPYVKFPCNWDRPPVKLGLDQYFVVGDNRSMAMVDHTFGEARRERIVGKVLL